MSFVQSTSDESDESARSLLIEVVLDIKLHPVIKNFLNQKGGETLTEDWQLQVNNCQMFKAELWPLIQRHIGRKVIIDGSNMRWDEAVFPVEEDLPNFVQFFDTAQRRTMQLGIIGDEELSRWSDGRTINLIICRHSNNVVTKANWTKIEKQLIKPAAKDRAGAAAESALHEMVEKLKQKHRFHLYGQYIAWRIWADWILKQPGDQWNSLVNDPPPGHMLHLFKQAADNSENLAETLRHNLSIGKSVSSSLAVDVKTIVTEFKLLKEAHANLTRAFESLESRLETLLLRCEVTNENLEMFENAVPVQPTQFSRDCFDQIRDQEDIDHNE